MEWAHGIMVSSHDVPYVINNIAYLVYFNSQYIYNNEFLYGDPIYLKHLINDTRICSNTILVIHCLSSNKDFIYIRYLC